MNDVGFPVSRVLDGIAAAAAAGLGVKVNAVVKRGVNDAPGRRARPPLPRHRPHPALHRVHGRRRHERLAPRRRRPGRGDRGADRRRVPARAGRGELPRRGRPALALSRRRRRDRRHRVGHAAVLRRLHPLAHLGRGPPLHLPVRHRGATTCARSCAAAPTTPSCTRRSAGIWGRRTDRYSEERSSLTADMPRVEMSYIGG